MTVRYDRVKYIVNQIKANPLHWDQNVWHCGTSHCFAGFCELKILNLPANTNKLIVDQHKNMPANRHYRSSAKTNDTFDNAQEWLQLSFDQAEWLFDHGRTLKDFENLVKHKRFPRGYRNAYFECDTRRTL